LFDYSDKLIGGLFCELNEGNVTVIPTSNKLSRRILKRSARKREAALPKLLAAMALALMSVLLMPGCASMSVCSGPQATLPPTAVAGTQIGIHIVNLIVCNDTGGRSSPMS